MTLVVSRIGIIARLDAIPVTRQRVVRSKVILAWSITQPGTIELPAYPIGRPLRSVVRQSILRLLHQIVITICRASSSTTGISQRQMNARG